MTKTIARIIEARPEVDVAPLSDLLGLEYLFNIPLRSLKSSHLRDTAKKIGGCCKKGTADLKFTKISRGGMGPEFQMSRLGGQGVAPFVEDVEG